VTFPEQRIIVYVAVLFALLIVGLVLMWQVPPRIRSSRRSRLFAERLPQPYIEILERNVPLYRKMTDDLRAELRGHVNVFLHEKVFRGCGGLEVTDEIRVTIAGHACILILKRASEYFPGFSSILVYPDTYLVNEVTYDGVVEVEGQDARSGESWHRGPVVLSWQDVLESVAGGNDGYNVVMHEFAHKLDEENGEVDGVPVLADNSHYKEWAAVLTHAYGSYAPVAEHAHGSTESVLDEYAFTAPEEFFAVATETFFEKASELKAELPELYEQLRRFYCVDPATWTG
jgi:Mlc titration factor MtfA (ptsG expression regulator)